MGTHLSSQQKHPEERSALPLSGFLKSAKAGRIWLCSAEAKGAFPGVLEEADKTNHQLWSPKRQRALAHQSFQAGLRSWHDGNGTEVQYYHWLSTG